jgi:hypothetical protein
LQIEEEWKKINAEKKRLGLEITQSSFSQQKQQEHSKSAPSSSPHSRQQPNVTSASTLANEPKETKTSHCTYSNELTSSPIDDTYIFFSICAQP